MAGAESELGSPEEELFAEYERRARERRVRRRRPPPSGGGPSLLATSVGRLLAGAVAGLALLTVVGLIALWPGAAHHAPSQALGGPTQPATVTAVRSVPCGGPTPQSCRQIIVAIDGARAPITLGPGDTTVKLTAGDHIRVSKVVLPRGAQPLPGTEKWAFADLDRHAPLLWLAVLAGLLALIVIRLRGLLAVAGVALSLVVVTTFVVPAILDGRPPVLVAVIGAFAVMFVTLVLTNGVGLQTMAAAVSIASALLLTVGVGTIAAHAINLNGMSSDLALYLSQRSHVSLQGIVLAGFVIGALGVLTDTAVTQASAVMALRRANGRLAGLALYRAAFAVGRDHLSATIHTLVLAYTGTALPLLLIMRISGVGAGDAVNTQDIAEPIAATLVGCLGLIASVPLTTGLTTALASRLPAEAIGDAHTHHHH
jgi:uncharacterized membrane protein